MSNLKTVLSLAVIGGLGACTASSQQSASLDALPKTKAEITTVKPGASITIESILPKTMTSGSFQTCLLYTSPSPRDLSTSRMPSSA